MDVGKILSKIENARNVLFEISELNTQINTESTSFKKKIAEEGNKTKLAKIYKENKDKTVTADALVKANWTDTPKRVDKDFETFKSKLESSIKYSPKAKEEPKQAPSTIKENIKDPQDNKKEEVKNDKVSSVKYGDVNGLFAQPSGNISSYRIHNSVTVEDSRIPTAIVALYNRGFALGFKDGTVSVWNANTMEVSWTKSGAHSGEITSLIYLFNKKNIASACSNGAINVWSIDNGSYLNIQKANTTRINFMAYALDGFHVFLAQDSSIQLLNVVTQTEVWNYDEKAAITAFCYDYANHHLYWGTKTGAFRRGTFTKDDHERQTLKVSKSVEKDFTGAITSIIIVNDTQIAVGSNEENVKIYEEKDVSVSKEFVPMANIFTKQLVSLDDAKSFFQIPEQGAVNIVDYNRDDAAIKKKTTVKKLTLNSNSKHVGGVYLGDGKSVVLISDNGNVNLWMN